MITARIADVPYETELTNGTHAILSDTSRDGVGGQAGLRPHELLEAALASCMAMTIRMVADEHSLDLGEVIVSVNVVREDEESIYDYLVELPDGLSSAERQLLLGAAAICPVSRTLRKRVSLRLADA